MTNFLALIKMSREHGVYWRARERCLEDEWVFVPLPHDLDLRSFEHPENSLGLWPRGSRHFLRTHKDHAEGVKKKLESSLSTGDFW